jgi:hypothetical protein
VKLVGFCSKGVLRTFTVLRGFFLWRNKYPIPYFAEINYILLAMSIIFYFILFEQKGHRRPPGEKDDERFGCVTWMRSRQARSGMDWKSRRNLWSNLQDSRTARGVV